MSDESSWCYFYPRYPIYMCRYLCHDLFRRFVEKCALVRTERLAKSHMSRVLCSYSRSFEKIEMVLPGIIRVMTEKERTTDRTTTDPTEKTPNHQCAKSFLVHSFSTFASRAIFSSSSAPHTVPTRVHKILSTS